MADSTRTFFDQIAEPYYQRNYDEPRDRHGYTLWVRRIACLALMPPPDGRVLDLGCGPGAMTVPLLEAGYDVVASDLSPEMTKEAGRRMTAYGEARAVVADAMALPFPDASFAAVVTTGVLEYVPDLPLAMQEIRRILRPGGTLIGTMSLPRRFERYVVKRYNDLRNRQSGAAQYILGRRAFDRVVEAAGFEIETRRCSSFAPFPLDAIWPKSVMLLDRYLGSTLDRFDVTRDLAKTYVVRARVTSTR